MNRALRLTNQQVQAMDRIKAEFAASKIGPPVPPKVKARLAQQRRRQAQANPAPLPITGKAKGMIAAW